MGCIILSRQEEQFLKNPSVFAEGYRRVLRHRIREKARHANEIRAKVELELAAAEEKIRLKMDRLAALRQQVEGELKLLEEFERKNPELPRRTWTTPKKILRLKT